MKKLNSRPLILPMVLIMASLLIIAGSTLAFFINKVSVNSTMSFGKVEITAGESESFCVPLVDVLAGDKITGEVAFGKAVDSEPMYVRAKVYFDTESSVPAVGDLVKELNSSDFGSTGETTEYKWTDRSNGFVYLVSKTDVAMVYEVVSADSIVLSDGFSIPSTLKQSTNYAQYMQKITFNIEIQSIQSASVGSALVDVDRRFAEVFGGEGGFAPTTPSVPDAPTTPSAPSVPATPSTPSTPSVTPATPDEPSVPEVSGKLKIGKYVADKTADGYTDNTNLVGSFYIEMGSYPQSKYEGDVSALSPVENESYMLEDADGNEARCDVFTDKTNNYVQYTNGEGVAYYKIEPVRWVVIGQADGSALPSDFDASKATLSECLVVSEKILTQRRFHSNTQTNKFADSEINSFLNGAFMSDLFTEAEINKIQSTQLKTTYFDGESVQYVTSNAKMFLLGLGTQGDTTFEDNYLVDSLYGAGVVTGTSYSALKARVTPLSFAMGVGVDAESEYGRWWLRSGSASLKNRAGRVSYDGGVSVQRITDTNFGVRPAFVVTL